MAVGVDTARSSSSPQSFGGANSPRKLTAISPVSLLAIEYARDFQVLALVAEEDPVVLGAKADQGRLDVPKLLCVPIAGLGVAASVLRICKAMGC